jgi:transcriptional regulator with XRE-family HTH domain
MLAIRYNNCMTFAEWITKKYLEYRGDAIGNSRSITDFAKLLGISQPLLSQWMMKKNGKTPESARTITQLVNYFGVEAYEALGLPVPGLSPENSVVYLSGLRELTRVANERGVSPDDPEFTHLAKEVFAKYDVKVEEID